LSNREIIEYLHPTLIPALAQVPKNVPAVLMTRHSIREQPKNGFAGYDVPLTPQGVELARVWGSLLDRPVSGFYSSPVGRCVATAEAMAEGCGLALPVSTHTSLVEPGSYVVDLAVAGPYFMKLGPLEFARQHLRNAVRGVLSPEQGARQLLLHFRDHLGDPGSVAVHVTHDTILASFIYHLLAEADLCQEHWPWMMEGAFLWFEDETVHWIWRGEWGRIVL